MRGMFHVPRATMHNTHAQRQERLHQQKVLLRDLSALSTTSRAAPSSAGRSRSWSPQPAQWKWVKLTPSVPSCELRLCAKSSNHSQLAVRASLAAFWWCLHSFLRGA
jgi:hypothetical protein